MSILVLNAGSSSLKLGLYDDAARPIAEGDLSWGKDREHAELSLAGVKTQHDVKGFAAAVDCALQALAPFGPREQIRTIGQRVVHGGTLVASAIIDDDVRGAIHKAAELAPLHNPQALEAIAAAAKALPGVPQVAVFDTSYFAQLPAAQQVYPLPYAWFEAWGVRRFGFHGISHAYCAARIAELTGRHDLGIISCHLGSGCSATASRGDVAMATTMGFTPLDGLMMGTRCGAVDPGILIHVQQHRGVSVDALDDVLNHQAGLAGVSGLGGDYRQVEAAAQAGHARAALALEIYAVRVREAIGALATSLGTLDALVFTAGVGQHSASLRASVCAGLGVLGVTLDDAKNQAAVADVSIGGGSGPAVWVLETREEWTIAREARRIRK